MLQRSKKLLWKDFEKLKFVMFNYYLLLAAAVFANFYLIYGYNEHRINNGELTPSNLFRFTTKIRGCTATVISNRHVLTAAHCKKHELIDASENINNNGKTYMVTKKIGDENEKCYFPITPKEHLFEWHDIAILEYPEDKNLTARFEPVKLAKDYVEKDGDEAYIAGFGVWWTKNGRSSSDSLQLRHAKISMNDYCYGSFQICGGNRTHRSLGGDSGGPMLINRNNQWYQIGVGSASANYDIRTRVSSYCNFIEEATQNEVKCESIYPENNIPMPPIKHFELIYKGKDTPLKLFDFVVPLYNYYYNQGCTATVISKRHLLTAAFCVYRDWKKNENKNAQLTEHSSYKTITGKLFPDFRSKDIQPKLNNDPVDDVTAYFPANYVWPWNHNLAVIEFPENVDFGVEPVTLAKEYFKIFLEEVIIAGFGRYDFKNNMHIEGSPPELQHSNATFQTTNWKIYLKDDNEMLMKDEGGPVLIDRNGKFYQIGVNFCSGTPNGYRTLVSSHCNFIEEVTKNEVKCESTAPIYEKPPSESTTTTQKPSSIAPKMNQFQMALFFFIFLFMLFCL